LKVRKENGRIFIGHTVDVKECWFWWIWRGEDGNWLPFLATASVGGEMLKMDQVHTWIDPLAPAVKDLSKMSFAARAMHRVFFADPPMAQDGSPKKGKASNQRGDARDTDAEQTDVSVAGSSGVGKVRQNRSKGKKSTATKSGTDASKGNDTQTVSQGSTAQGDMLPEDDIGYLAFWKNSKLDAMRRFQYGPDANMPLLLTVQDMLMSRHGAKPPIKVLCAMKSQAKLYNGCIRPFETDAWVDWLSEVKPNDGGPSGGVGGGEKGRDAGRGVTEGGGINEGRGDDERGNRESVIAGRFETDGRATRRGMVDASRRKRKRSETRRVSPPRPVQPFDLSRLFSQEEIEAEREKLAEITRKGRDGVLRWD
jgi:hypothetical protein